VRQPLRERVRDSVRLRALDARDRLGGRADRLVPPRRLGVAGRADFVAEGDELLGRLVELCDLQPAHAVLDVGCGSGRLARPLAGFLSREGSYDGFDADRECIGWCRRRYARLPHFGFRVADVVDPRRNPGGAHRADEYRFPYDDASFDVVILSDVLTHLLEDAADHHLAEAARVLRPGGRALLTLFLLDDASRAAIAEGLSGLDFLEFDAHVAVVSEDVPEEAVAYDAAWLEERLGAHGLRLADVRAGSWSGRQEHTGFADLVVARRPA
jgi:SAM-dependent methyltransferase